jgi:signal transduction histidine kinase
MRRIPWTDAVLAAGLTILGCAEAIGYADGSGRHLAGSLILLAGAVSVAIGVAMIGGAFVLGLLMRRQRRDTAHSVERAAQAERAREEHAAEAVAAEQARIARDLHDVVAHAISVIVLQARGGRRMLDVDPAQSRAAFDAVELLAGQAMTDMRRMVRLVARRTPTAIWRRNPACVTSTP